MERVLTHPSLVRCLSRLPIRTPGRQIKLWIQQKRALIRITSLVKALGKPSLTTIQAKCLDSLGLGFKELLQLRDSHSKEDFLSCLKEKVYWSGKSYRRHCSSFSSIHSHQLKTFSTATLLYQLYPRQAISVAVFAAGSLHQRLYHPSIPLRKNAGY